ncbi:unnamed protein product [Parajaminaea phylloscopi]
MTISVAEVAQLPGTSEQPHPTRGEGRLLPPGTALPDALPLLSAIPPISASTGTQKVLVVGGGPSGVVSLRNLTSPHEDGSVGFDTVLYERREDVGGVWFLDDDTLRLESAAGYISQWPVESTSHPRFPSPAYPKLIGNVYPRFLTFSGAPWPALPNGEKFPTLEETYNYIASVAKPLHSRIKTKRKVEQVWELPVIKEDGASSSLPRAGGHLVLTRDYSVNPPRALYEHFSAVHFCPSFTTHPLYPNIPGLAAALKTVPRRIHHAKWYRTVDLFWKSKRVVVVGNGLSSNDIVSHIVLKRKEQWGEERSAEEEPVYRAIRHEPLDMFPSLPDERILETPYVTRIDLRSTTNGEEPALDLTLANGDVLTDVDHVIFGTGYQVGVYDWVHVQARQAGPADYDKLQAAGVAIEDGHWKVDSDRLAREGFDPAALGLDDLWADLTPPQRLPQDHSGKAAESSARPSPTRTLHSLTTKMPADPEVSYRVPHLHFHVVNARNPTISFGALMVSFAPFVLADLLSHYVRTLWEGRQVLSDVSFDERRIDELQRMDKLAELRAQRDRDATTHELVLLNRRPGSTSIQVPSLVPNLAFHLLGKEEYLWHLELRQRILTAKPCLANVVGLRAQDWDPARDEDRQSMYGEKRKWLERREQARRAALGIATGDSLASSGIATPSR